MDNITPTGIPGPSKKTIDYIRTFARLYRPHVEAHDGLSAKIGLTDRATTIASC